MSAIGRKSCMTCHRKLPPSAYTRSRRCDDCWARLYGGPCDRCGAPVPIVRTISKRRRYCDDPVCQAAGHSKAGKTRSRKVAERTRKRCASCGKVKPLTPEHWHSNRVGPGGALRCNSYCRPCANADQVERYATDERRRARARESAKAARARIKARREVDPEFDRQHREKVAGYARAYKARKGGKGKQARRAVVEQAPRVPVGPLVPLIDTYVRRGQMHAVDDLDAAPTLADLCAGLGIHSRTWSAWRAGVRQTVNFDTADRVLTGLGVDWAEAYDEADFPEAHPLAKQLFGGA